MSTGGQAKVQDSAIRFDGQVAIVTGAGNGLGRSYALSLADRGAAVVVNDLGVGVDGSRGANSADLVVKEIVARGGQAVSNDASVASRSGGQAIVDHAIQAFGRVDMVVTNAGIQRETSYDSVPDTDMYDMVNVHLLGSFFVTQAACQVMRTNRYGRVVFITSTSGLFGRPNTPGYNAAKAGVVGLLNSLAIEGASDNILANAIAPVARTRMNSMYFGPELAERLDPEIVTQLVLYLASSRCSSTQQIFEAGAERYARIFIGRTVGWYPEDGKIPSPEMVADHFDEIRELTGFVVPQTAADDLRDAL
jgi:NAD(P)-dependent dehydrogenase (short-subunit alcohol dehydrogenase family)